MAETLNRHYSDGVGDSATTVFTAPAHTTPATVNMSVVCSVIVCNTHSAEITVDVTLTPAGTSTTINICNDVQIPAKNSIEAIQSRLFLKHDGTNADVIKVLCNEGAYADVLISTVEGLN